MLKSHQLAQYWIKLLTIACSWHERIWGQMQWTQGDSQEYSNRWLDEAYSTALGADVLRWAGELPMLCTRHAPSAWWSDHCSMGRGWVEEGVCHLSAEMTQWPWAPCTLTFGTPGVGGALFFAELITFCTSSLLLRWRIVRFLLPAHQTRFNELFLFSCLPAIKSYPLPWNVPAQGWLAWQLRLLIRIHWCQVCTNPLTLTTWRCVCPS